MKVSGSRVISQIRSIRPWYLLLLTVISVVVCVYALRANNEHMNQLRNQVFSADKNGGNVEAALQSLAKYVTSNMNTNLSSGANSVYPPIQLTYSYTRVTSSLSQNLQQQNSMLYTVAENYCQKTIPTGFSGHYRIACIEQYITSHGLNEPNIPSSLYEFDFISPRWSPDLAGWTMLLSIFLVALSVLRLTLSSWLKRASN